MAESRLTRAQALALLRGADLLELGRLADRMREALHPEGRVTFVVDRNINYTNVCLNKCRFCAFYREEGSPGGYVLTDDELCRKIDETLDLGGRQILLQGGLNPALGIEYYLDMLRLIKMRYPEVTVHGFSPPEIVFIAERADLTVREALWLLRQAGLDSIPGGGAEVLSDRVREAISPRKIKSGVWLNVMLKAHMQGIRSSATMMFGSEDTLDDIVEHLDALRGLQDRTGGFTAFIPWPFQPGNTEYEGTLGAATAADYLRVLAVSRLYLDNFENVQASWVTQGLKVAQVALRFGANDLGSTMIEENVVAAAGVSHRVSMAEMVEAIRGAGFEPWERDNCYGLLRPH